MKIALVVASGVHQGKPIPVLGPQLVIGRDEGCQLRPASPAVSKRHCAVFARDGKVFVEDFDSTNGTFVNDEPVKGRREVADGDRLKVGPLDFTITVTQTKSDTTPLPDALKAVDRSGPRGATPAGGTKPPSRPALPKAPPPADDADAAAAMLLGMGDEDPPGSEPEVPGGSTIMEMPSVDAEKKAAEEKKKGVPSQAETSAAASEILRKYMRRPK